MVFLTIGRRHLATAAIVALTTSWSVPARANQTTNENDVKAAFLYNFTKFIEWPPPPAPAADPFRLCVLADAEFTRAVDSTIADESVDGRRLLRVAPQSVDEVRGCAILYVGRGYLDRGERLLAAARDLPVLTVGEGSQFVEHGGAIGFVLENNRVRFDVSSRAVQRSGLKVSSKLLRVARSVQGGAR
jgi:hypothetical protein